MMLLRALGSTLVLSAMIASAIALAQSSDSAVAERAEVQTADVLPATAADPNAVPTTAPSATAPALTPLLTPAPTLAPTPATAKSYAPGQVDQVYLTYPPGVGPQPINQPFAQYETVRTSQGFVTRPVQISPEEQQHAAEFHEAVAQLRGADTPEKKEAARARLGEIVSAQLERDFKQREQKLAEIEARAKELRDQLEQRRSTKAEIQKMLMLMIENPETGIGLPPAWMNTLIQPGVRYETVYGGNLPGAYQLPRGPIQHTQPSLPSKVQNPVK